jgi:ATP/maltotriose-dependent transcriptional regulator MalT
MIRCLYEFSQIPEVLTQLEILKANALKNKSLIIFWLCEVGEIRILCRDLNNFVEVSKRIDSFRSKVASDPALKNLTWLLDIAEIFLKGATNESLRLDQLFDRNSEIPYVKFLSKSKSKDSNEKLYEELKRSPENTPFQVIYKNLYLSKFRVEGLKKHRAYLNTALNLGEKVGAREIFLRQDIKTLEAIIDLAKDSKSHWLESLGRDCLDRIKEKNSLLQFDGEHLTQREIEVLRYLSTDYSVEKIGKSLHISKNTMKTHLKNIYRKLKVDNRKQATAIAKTKLLI